MTVLPSLSISDQLASGFASLALGREPAHQPPRLLIYWPRSRRNQFHDLLYSRASERGYFTISLTRLEDLQNISWPGPIVFHAHWFNGLFRTCSTEDDARAATENAFELIEAFRKRTGSVLIWTAHNTFPHDNAFPDTYLSLRRSIVERFDFVHVMSPEHVPILEAAYGLPLPKTFCVPHMLYSGVFPVYTTQAEARTKLGLKSCDFLFGFFGSIQAYKGLRHLVSSFRQLADSSAADLHLLIAGSPTNEDVTNQLISDCLGDPRITVIANNEITNELVQYFLLAPDTIIFPYEKTLNSGAGFAAATFGVPIIAPDTQAFRSVKAVGTPVFLYDAERPEALKALMQSRIFAEVPIERVTASPAFAPEAISNSFFDALDLSVTQT